MQTIGVFFGGKSPEHDVSIITGQLIIAGLKKLGHQVVPVYLDKQGSWFLNGQLGTIKYFTRNKFSNNADFEKYYLDLEKSRGKMVFRAKGLLGKETAIDLAFPAFHGQNGEDGTIQGVFEIFNVPYVGCDVTSSAMAMDKIITKQMYVQQGIPTADFVFFDRDSWQADKSARLREIKNALQLPVFVKPAALGSSIGIAKAKDEKALELAIEVALHYGNRVIVENAVENLMDITCAILGNQDLITSELQESVFSDELFSYQEKYLNDGGAQLGAAQKNIIIPARLDAQTTDQIKATAKQVFRLLGCSGMARVDFLYDKTGKKFYANEVNTLPGTLYHHLWRSSGLALPQLLTKLLDLASEKHRAKQKVTYTFESEILEQANSAKLNLKKDV